MTQIAQEYHISRTWLYQLIRAANLQLETLFGEQKPHTQDSQILFEPLILLLRLEGKCSLPSLSSILTYFQYQPIPWGISVNASNTTVLRYRRPLRWQSAQWCFI